MKGHTLPEARAILLDIEGTISPLAFVREVLFPYSRSKISSFILANQNRTAVVQILAEASRLSGGLDPVTALVGWHDRDEKSPPLKELQGLIWEQGYREGALVSTLFIDALEAIRQWNQSGIPVYIYSSGSLHAQDLFFEHNEAGDLRALFSGFFDTGIGAKTASASYEEIVRKIDIDANSLLFLSDSVAELRAAEQAGLMVMHVVKDATVPVAGFKPVHSFRDILAPRL